MSGKDFNAFVAAAFRRHRTEQESLGTTEGNSYLVKPAFADFIQLLKNNVNVFADFFIAHNNFFAFPVFSLQNRLQAVNAAFFQIFLDFRYRYSQLAHVQNDL